MAFALNDAFLPATLSAHPMTDEEFYEFCSQHPGLFFEMTAESDLIVMAPTHSLTGARNSEILGQLRDWAKQDKRGVSCDSSTGFVLPNGARRSPDASWTLKSRIPQTGFWHLCPDFVIELKSTSDRPRTLHKKMLEYLANGAQLGWLIDPETQSVTIYRPDCEAEKVTNLSQLAGEAPVAGFVMDLSQVWNPLGN